MRKLPKGFTLLTSIRSNGTQWMNTKLPITSDNIKGLRIELVTRNVEQGKQSISGISGTPFLWGGITAMSPYHYYYSNGVTEISSGIVSDMIKHKFIMDGVNGVYSVEGVFSVNTDFSTSNKSDNATFCLFGWRNGATNNVTPTYCDIYSFMAWLFGVLVCNYVPCINPLGEVGMYDFVTEAFVGNDGTGEFIAGDPVVWTSLGMWFERRRMVAVAKKEPKYVWAVYDFSYVEDENVVSGSTSLSASAYLMMASAYTIQNGKFVLTNPKSVQVRSMSSSRPYTIALSGSATSGDTLYSAKLTVLSGEVRTVSYTKYALKAVKGDTELYRVESDTLDYPVDGEQDGLWYVLVEGGGVLIPFEQPVLTANGALGGNAFAVSASNELSATYGAYNAFGPNESVPYAASVNPSTTPVDFVIYNPIALILNKITISNVPSGFISNAPKDVVVYGSSDGDLWEQIATGKNTSNAINASWNIDVRANKSYKYFKLHITSAHTSEEYVNFNKILLDAYEEY